MGMFSEMARGFIAGALAASQDGRGAYPNRLQHVTPTAVVENILDQLGWGIDEMDGDRIGLHFNESTRTRRVLYIDCGGSDRVATFIVYSRLTYPHYGLPANVMSNLLARNAAMALGSWATAEASNRIYLALTYRAQIDSMEAAFFKQTCESMVKEAIEFDFVTSVSGLRFTV